MIKIIMMLLTFIPLGIYFIKMKNYKFEVKNMILISMFAAVAYILSMIPLIKYPQGGGIALLSMLPIMIISVLYGKKSGLTCGLIFGILQLIGASTLIHPAQIMLDYILSSMVLGLCSMYGTKNKMRIFCGAITAVIISCMYQVLSGYIFFGDYAPVGTNPFLYSLIYNFSGKGLEGLLSAIVLIILPINRLKKAA